MALLFGSLLVLGGILAFNAYKDPFADFLFLTGLNVHPIQRIDNSCDVKFKVGLLKSLPLDSIDVAVFGSSRPFRIDPESAGLKEIGCRSYNLAIQGATLPTIKSMIDFAKKKNPLMTCIVGLDFFAFGKNDNVPSLYLDSRRSWQANFDSFKRLIDFQTLLESLRPWNPNARHVLLANGRSLINIGTEERKNMLNYLEKYSNETKKINEKAAKFVYDPRLVEDLIIFKKKNKKIIFFLNPDSKWYLKPLMNSVLWKDYVRWKNDISKIGDVIDFSECYEITENSEMYFDEVHYLDNAGEMILEDIANSYFGRPLKHGKKMVAPE
jgi:hypothetical protein